MVAAGLAPARALALSKNLVQGVPLNQEVAAEAQKLGIKIIEMKPVPVVTDLLMTTRSFIKKDEVTVRRFMQGYAAAIQYFVSKREESFIYPQEIFSRQSSRQRRCHVRCLFGAASTAAGIKQRSASGARRCRRDGRPAHKNLKPADITEPRFFDELKNSHF